MGSFHTPVMPEEVIRYLNIRKGSWYIDCNLGGGGHTEEILRAGGKVLGIDLDKDAILEVAKLHNLTVNNNQGHLVAQSDRLILVQSNFSELGNIISQFIDQPIQGILFDLGVSTHQLETINRGFSFNFDAPLDMRMNTSIGATAADLVNGLHEKELTQLFLKFGEERFAKPIARRIVEVRQKQSITSTNQLAQIILSVRHRNKNDQTHPATRVFQALRIAVNDELNSLKEALPQSLSVLAPGARLVAISFHSLEDRIVKKFFINEQKSGSIKIITQKPITPTGKEIDQNPRSRSGKLRVAEKI